MLELIFAIGILTTVVIPLGFFLNHEQKLCQVYYQRAVAMEIVDGEMEALVAGEWRKFKHGSQGYFVKAESAKNLPLGHFMLTVDNKRIRLEWVPVSPNKGGKVFREFLIP